ncbi:MAG TPA: hypothetical protein VNC50_06550, partial [Planctomycetia bacterium]|nr:hypothetical protein [Planctomycetia bacterium]
MPWPELEAAIRAGDPDAVVDATAGWNEAERKKAAKPFQTLTEELFGLFRLQHFQKQKRGLVKALHPRGLHPEWEREENRRLTAMALA